jgi:hypothetical protein
VHLWSLLGFGRTMDVDSHHRILSGPTSVLKCPDFSHMLDFLGCKPELCVGKLCLSLLQFCYAFLQSPFLHEKFRIDLLPRRSYRYVPRSWASRCESSRRRSIELQGLRQDIPFSCCASPLSEHLVSTTGEGEIRLSGVRRCWKLNSKDLKMA